MPFQQVGDAVPAGRWCRSSR